jgi:hypothetical protein
MRPANQEIAQTIRLLQCQPENPTDQSRCGADDKRQKCENDQAAIALRGLLLGISWLGLKWM